jgi:hypothetical protein
LAGVARNMFIGNGLQFILCKADMAGSEDLIVTDSGSIDSLG